MTFGQSMGNSFHKNKLKELHFCLPAKAREGYLRQNSAQRATLSVNRARQWRLALTQVKVVSLTHQQRELYWRKSLSLKLPKSSPSCLKLFFLYFTECLLIESMYDFCSKRWGIETNDVSNQPEHNFTDILEKTAYLTLNPEKGSAKAQTLAGWNLNIIYWPSR